MENQGYRYTLNRLDIFEPIILDRETIGTIFLQSDLDEAYARLSWYIQGSVAVLVLSLLIAYLLLVRLQRRITGPILDLAVDMNTVSRDKNFAVRATVQSRDEIGALAEGFNDMLAHIQIRDNELEQYRENLEEIVAARTAAFEHANNQLQQELKARRQYEEGLVKTTKQLEKSNKELEEFAYIASHDLQEPLRKVQAFGDRLNQKYGEILAGPGKEYLDRMQNAAGRMQVLIQSLLEYSRITSKAQEFEPVNLEIIVEEVLSDLEIRLEQVKGQVEVGDLPVINGDPVQMRQLFQNLIGNALKFHREGVTPFISITGRVLTEMGEASPPVRYCEIRVADNGIGFDQKYVDRIFGIFQRLHGRTEYEGTGIGLSVCRKIVERHGGTIIAESSPDAGATFIIKLPI
jgi:signal transduction histidine kinase